MAAMVTVNDVLNGHVVLDVECLDRIYLNGYVPNLQVGGQVVSFMTTHLGYPIPSPAILEKIGTTFRKAVDRFAADNQIPLVRFSKGDRKVDVMRPYLAARAATGRSGVAAIGVAQEFQNVFASSKRTGDNGVPWFSFAKADRRVTCFYFYVWDASGFDTPSRLPICPATCGNDTPARSLILQPASWIVRCCLKNQSTRKVCGGWSRSSPGRLDAVGGGGHPTGPERVSGPLHRGLPGLAGRARVFHADHR